MRPSHASTFFAAVLVLAACNPEAPPPPAGVGFGNYAEYQARRDAVLAGVPEPAPLAISDERSGSFDAAGSVSEPASEAESIAAAATAAIGRESGAGAADAPLPDLDNPGISDEQDFQAVAGRESIESDAERLARQRAVRQQVAPEPLPDRPGDTGPNIVEYALATTNQVGEPVYSRRSPSVERADRNCAKYASPDRAQVAFLEAGGPDRDRLGLDPDGDGFACAWTPAPFRAARGG